MVKGRIAVYAMMIDLILSRFDDAVVNLSQK
jgi:hypothetical protein